MLLSCFPLVHSFASAPSAKSRHRLVIIGGGGIGERHLCCTQSTGRADVFACETQPARWQEITARYGVKSFTYWEEALEQVDALVICTPGFGPIGGSTMVPFIPETAVGVQGFRYYYLT